MIANRQHFWNVAVLAMFLTQVANAPLALHLYQANSRHLCLNDATAASAPVSPSTSHRHPISKHRHDEAHCPFCTLIFKVIGKYTTPPIDIGLEILTPDLAVTPRVCQPPRHARKRPWSARPPPPGISPLS